MNKIQILCNNDQKLRLNYMINEFVNRGWCPFVYDEEDKCSEDCEGCINRNIIYKCIVK